MVDPFLTKFISAIVSGVGARTLYFTEGEHHIATSWIALAYLVLSALMISYEVITHIDGRIQGILCGVTFVGTHVLSVWTSTIIYRLWFH